MEFSGILLINVLSYEMYMEFSGIILIDVLSYEIYRFTCLQKYLSRKKLCHCHCSIL